MTFEQRRAQLIKNSEFYPNYSVAGGSEQGSNTIKNLAVGTVFANRKELSSSGVHVPTFAGISGSVRDGARSIVLSGGYEDDGDKGDVITYTGTGGQVDSFGNPGPQVQDQTFNHPMNAALLRSYQTQKPLRVIRGYGSPSKYAPAEGYRYDGMYKVTKAYLDKGLSGFQVCKFRLERLPGQRPIPIPQGWRDRRSTT
ncbi:hypothetical protein GYMLUDRAFT_39529 [Collybiopsis luxurians FD-317 M1]|nr:hypothetical protein GYMLUDRAFT_39529 [Collybiopsis luxurians FD-317 M1]